MNKERFAENLKKLSLAFGPSGCEEEISRLVLEMADGLYDECIRDCFGNVILKINIGGYKKPLMVSSHMDEVGFIISDIDEYGYLHFQNVGGISSSAIPGRRVKVEKSDGGYLSGVISSKAIHLQSKDEREKPFKASSLVIDIGASSRGEAMKYTEIGNYATFDSEYVIFGENSEYIKSKALDDRLGCAIMIEAMHALKNKEYESDRDIYFCFTTREELGLSGALVAANKIRPEYAIVLETTAVSDIAGTPEGKKVAKLKDGGCVSFADRSTIYNKDFVTLAFDAAEEYNIPCQIKKYVSGGNDAGHIHKSASGVKTLAISAPTRYLHSASCVLSIDDAYSIYSLLTHIILNL